MALKIDILLPTGTLTYTTGVGICQSINVHYYFANIVYVIVYFVDGSKSQYYQVPCILTTSP